MKNAITCKEIFTVPNFLTLIRILLSPLFVVLYFQTKYELATVVLLCSGLTDVLDGIIARKFNLITSVGKILDPIADKLTQAVIIVCLTVNHYNDEDSLLIFVLILLFAKEFTMLLGAIVLFKSGARPSESKWWGKLGTVMIYVLFVATLMQDIFTAKIIPVEAINVLSIITAICLVFSLFNYYPIFKEIQNGEYEFESEKHSD
ncbi:MAG: CDP-alcohol phosphatidyltransferase family protein [Clostridia bacterium]|nr:CDP-alcohol phosphatidyltransferase family protein [Clostridia bacterium]